MCGLDSILPDTTLFVPARIGQMQLGMRTIRFSPNNHPIRHWNIGKKEKFATDCIQTHDWQAYLFQYCIVGYFYHVQYIFHGHKFCIVERPCERPCEGSNGIACNGSIPVSPYKPVDTGSVPVPPCKAENSS